MRDLASTCIFSVIFSLFQLFPLKTVSWNRDMYDMTGNSTHYLILWHILEYNTKQRHKCKAGCLFFFSPPRPLTNSVVSLRQSFFSFFLSGKKRDAFCVDKRPLSLSLCGKWRHSEAGRAIIGKERDLRTAVVKDSWFIKDTLPSLCCEVGDWLAASENNNGRWTAALAWSVLGTVYCYWEMSGADLSSLSGSVPRLWWIGCAARNRGRSFQKENRRGKEMHVRDKRYIKKIRYRYSWSGICCGNGRFQNSETFSDFCFLNW